MGRRRFRHATLLLLGVLRAVGAGGAPDDGQAVRAWPTPRSAKAIREGTLVLDIVEATETIDTFQAVELQINLLNKGAEPVDVPANWTTMLGVEIVPEGGAANPLTWMPPAAGPKVKCRVVPPSHNPGVVHTCHWMACKPLTGLPENDPYLRPGRCRYRLILPGEPALRSGWRRLQVRKPGVPARAGEVWERRGGGRLLLVEHRRCCPEPDGSAQRPYNHLAQALAQAKSGDVVFCTPGWHITVDCAVPDDVWLVGAGAASTVIVTGSLKAEKPMVPRIRLSGKSRMEGLTIIDRGDAGRGALIRAEGKDCHATLYQCVLLPAASAFAGLQCAYGAAPTVRNCVIVSPLGDYGVFARWNAKPVLESCTIFSRGFGVGMMSSSVVTIRSCTIAGRCPGIITDDGRFEIAESVIWCPRHSPASTWHPVTRSLAVEGEIKYVPMPEVLAREDILAIDPQFTFNRGVLGFLSVRDGSDAAAYGAFAGPGGTWPGAEGNVPWMDWVKLPKLK